MIDSEKLTKWYDFQAAFYGWWRNDTRHPTVERLASLFPDERLTVLDAGCGTGLLALGLATRRPGWRIEGIDASSGMLDVARRACERNRLKNVTLRQGDVCRLPYGPGQFDAVVAGGLFPNLNDWGAAMREFFRVLRPGGRLVVVEFDRGSMRRPTRLFFRGMIWGYKAVSFLLRRFRFAEEWNIETSTIERALLAEQLRAAGFRERETLTADDHLIFHYEREARPCRDS